MNKTININLAGLFFHIDEDAYAKLQRYLDAIKRSFTDAEGRDEIIQDIEARIAELFTERIKNERQVIGLTEVDKVIEIMGQPEDYRIDDEIFEDEQPKATPYTSTRTKKLYRDTENSYLGGVSSGLGHYLGIAPVWLRVLFVVLAFVTNGGFALLYIGFWIFVPAAKTTAQKLEMRGEPVNIDNIQRKVKEGFDDVADTVKNMNYKKYGNQAKKGAGSAAEGIGKIFVLLLTVLAKLIGILLIIVGGTTIVGLFIGLFTAGTLGFIDGGISDYINFFNAGSIPFWLLSLLLFFALAIPFFALFYLGLKILVTNLKRMSWAMKITLIVVWLASNVVLIAVGINQAMDFSQRASTTQSEQLQINPTDTLSIKMTLPENVKNHDRRVYFNMNDDGNPLKSFNVVSLNIKKSENNQYQLELIKTARGYDNASAREHSEDIVYTYTLENNTLSLPETFNLAENSAFRVQELELVLYIPENSYVFIEESSSAFLDHRSDVLGYNSAGHYLQLLNGKLVCSDCPEESATDNDSDWEYRDISEEATDAGTYEYDKAREKRSYVPKERTEIDTLEKTLDSLSN